MIGLEKTTLKGANGLAGKYEPCNLDDKEFGLTPKEKTETTCIIMVQQGEETSTMGMSIDKRSAVIHLLKKEHELAHPMQLGISDEDILSRVKSQGALNILLDVDHVLSCNKSTF